MLAGAADVYEVPGAATFWQHLSAPSPGTTPRKTYPVVLVYEDSEFVAHDAYPHGSVGLADRKCIQADIIKTVFQAHGITGGVVVALDSTELRFVRMLDGLSGAGATVSGFVTIIPCYGETSSARLRFAMETDASARSACTRTAVHLLPGLSLQTVVKDGRWRFPAAAAMGLPAATTLKLSAVLADSCNSWAQLKPGIVSLFENGTFASPAVLSITVSTRAVRGGWRRLLLDMKASVGQLARENGYCFQAVVTPEEIGNSDGWPTAFLCGSVTRV